MQNLYTKKFKNEHKSQLLNKIKKFLKLLYYNKDNKEKQ